MSRGWAPHALLHSKAYAGANSHSPKHWGLATSKTDEQERRYRPQRRRPFIGETSLTFVGFIVCRQHWYNNSHDISLFFELVTPIAITLSQWRQSVLKRKWDIGYFESMVFTPNFFFFVFLFFHFFFPKFPFFWDFFSLKSMFFFLFFPKFSFFSTKSFFFFQFFFIFFPIYQAHFHLGVNKISFRLPTKQPCGRSSRHYPDKQRLYL